MEKNKNQRAFWQTKICETKPDGVYIRGYPLKEITGNLTYAEAVYLTLRGRLPNEKEAKMFEALLCGLVAYGIYPPMAAARHIVSANPEPILGIATAIFGAGKYTISPQDGGALIYESYELMKRENLTMEELAKRVVDKYAKEKKRIPGFGHGAFPQADPRSVRLRELSEKYEMLGEKTIMYETIHREFAKTPGKEHIPINIDGRFACILTELEFKPKEMVGVAVLSLLPGMIAHVMEELDLAIPLRRIPKETIAYVGEPERHLPKEKIKT